MLDAALNFIAREFNSFLQRRTGSASLGQITPGPILDEDGKLAIAKGGLSLSLINLEEEKSLREQAPSQIYQEGHLLQVQPPIQVNLILLIAARMGDYPSSLKALSYVLAFFQSRPVFSADEYPGLNDGIDRLCVELLSFPPETLNQIWGYLGAKHQPSLFYKLRMLTIQDTEPFAVGAPITDISYRMGDKTR